MRGWGVKNVVVIFETCLKYAILVIYGFRHVIHIVHSDFLLIV
jgi:hypothetical protein